MNNLLACKARLNLLLSQLNVFKILMYSGLCTKNYFLLTAVYLKKK